MTLFNKVVNHFRKSSQLALFAILSASALLTWILYSAYELEITKKDTETHITTLGKIIAGNTWSAVSFRDKAYAQNQLDLLKAYDEIEAAEITDKKGEVLAIHYNKKYADHTIPLTRLGWNSPTLKEIIYNSDKDAIGTLYIRANLYPVWLESLQKLVALFLILLIIFYGAWQTMCQLVEQLASARDAAQESSQAKSQFLANMSHDLRTPLNAIIGMSELTLKTPLEVEAKHNLRQVLHSAKILLHIINDILDFSKNEVGKLQLHNEEFNFNKMLETVADVVAWKPTAKQKGKKVDLLFQVDERIPPLLIGDAYHLDRVLTNLYSNAVKFTDQGEVVIGAELELHNREAGIARVRFWVRDTGIGIEPEQREKLFQPFTQLDASSTRNYDGTGLGLTISQRLVELMGGELQVESTPGQGSIFTFSVDFAVPRNRLESAPLRLEQLQDLRLLVVDDNASARQIFTQMGQSLGFIVEAVADGGAALAKINETQAAGGSYGLILMDWRLSEAEGADGLAIVQKLEAQFAAIPAIIMVTAYGHEEVHQAAIRQGIALSSVLNKPVTRRAFITAIGKALGTPNLVEDENEPAEDEAILQAKRRLYGARLLLVEDNDINQDLVCKLLSSAGIHLLVANNGREAMQLLNNRPAIDVDGVLMDCQMPVMDGYDATRAIRRIASREKLPIIGLSANVMRDDKDKALKAGMNDYVTKPLTEAALFSALVRHITPVQHEDSETDSPAPAPLPSALPGIDIQNGLARCRQDHEFYRSMLAKFYRNHQAFAARCGEALQAGDQDSAGRLAHTLKSNAAQLGIQTVSRCAGILEQCCKEQSTSAENLHAALRATEEALQVVLPGLAALNQSSAPPNAPKPGLSFDQAMEVLGRLRQLLAQRDAEAVDFLSQLDDFFQSLDGVCQQYQKLRNCVTVYEFKPALQELAALDVLVKYYSELNSHCMEKNYVAN